MEPLTPDVLDQLYQLPRDTTVVVQRNGRLARALHQRGFHVVQVGSDEHQIVESPESLRENWSRLSLRSPHAACIGNRELCGLVDGMAERSRVNAATSSHRSRSWARNLLRNIHHLREPLAMDIEGLEGVPGFIVGAGPSLDNVIDLLPECYKRGFVLGINAAARTGWCHAALTIESNDLRFKLGSLDGERAPLRFFGMTSHPEVMRHGTGPLMPVYSGEIARLLEPLTGHVKLQSCSNGGTAALSLLERLGCNPIILVGHDFSYTDGGRVYPKCLGIGDSYAHREGDHWRYEWAPVLAEQPRDNPMHEGDEIMELPGVGGGTVTAAASMRAPWAWMAQAAGRLAGQHTCVQASHRSSYTAPVADIPNWMPVPLKQVLRDLPPRNIDISVAREGIDREALRRWLDGQRDAAARVASCDPFRPLTRLDRHHLIQALRQCPIIEAWAQPDVFAIMAEWRSGPHLNDDMAECAMAAATEQDVIEATQRAASEVMTEIDDALGRLE